MDSLSMGTKRFTNNTRLCNRKKVKQIGILELV